MVEKTRQQEIREGLKGLYIEQPVGESDYTHSGLTYLAIDSVLTYLNSQGVVLKIEKPAPNFLKWANSEDLGEAVKDGWSATERLIEKE